eukprot:sb/3463771/
MVRADTFVEGLQGLVNDTGTEYPNHINSLKRFNVYPEVVLGGIFRIFSHLTAAFDVEHLFKACYTINRGNGLSPVTSCDGLGDEMVFYVNCVFAMAGLQVSIMFYFGSHLAGNILGGLLAVSSFFYNHSECSRVQWIPALRESFSFPLLLLQTLLLSQTLRNGPSKPRLASLFLATLATVLPWQFCPFALFTQVLSLFAAHTLFRLEHLTPALDTICVAFLVGAVLQFFNPMLISSLYLASYVALRTLVWWRNNELGNIFLTLTRQLWAKKTTAKDQGKSSTKDGKKQKNTTKKPESENPTPPDKLLTAPVTIRSVLVDGVIFVTLTALYKVTSGYLLQLSDDAHIFNILRAKFTSYGDFHTMLYTCSPAFDFIGVESFLKLTITLLLPVAVCVVGRLGYLYFSQLYHTTQEGEGRLDGVYAYHVFQLACYTGMAVLLMRLKLFMTPYMCVMSGLAASNAVLPQTNKSRYCYDGVWWFYGEGVMGVAAAALVTYFGYFVGFSRSTRPSLLCVSGRVRFGGGRAHPTSPFFE